jgi:predicted Rossmann-fold nucleotide-binding protein
MFSRRFGTMDEMFEILTLLQTGKIKKKMLLVVYDERFWKKIINLEGLIDHGVINREDVANLSFCNNVDQAFSLITKHFEKYYLKKGDIENGEPKVDLK